jgi:hypothetical protein
MTERNRAARTLSLTGGAALTLALAGCGGSGGSGSGVVIRSINAVPDGGTASFNVNGGTIAQQNFFTGSGYQSMGTGTSAFTFTLSSESGVTYPTQNDNLTGSKYSEILFGLASATTAGGTKYPTLSVISDTDTTSVPAGSVRIRFIHAAPDATAATVTANGVQETANLAYTGITAYQTLTAGTYSILFNPSAGGTSFAPTQNLTFTAGHRYTIFLTEPTPGATPVYAIQSLDDGT